LHEIFDRYEEALAYRQAVDADAAQCEITLDKPVMLLSDTMTVTC
jgi:hypothetical protein